MLYIDKIGSYQTKNLVKISISGQRRIGNATGLMYSFKYQKCC